MKTWILLLALCGAGQVVQAKQTLHYMGDAFTTNMKDGSVVRSPYVIERTTDPDAGTITERVVSKVGDKYEEFTTVMTVESNHIALDMGMATMAGEGTATGEPWKWTSFKLEIYATNPGLELRIVDYNYFVAVAPQVIMAHKDFYQTNAGKEELIQQEDLFLHVTDEATYLLERASLLGHW